jgi:hypothetical protein
MVRLDDQIAWYDRRSGTNQRMYKGVKLVQIVLAAAIPVLAGVKSAGAGTAGVSLDLPLLLGALGAMVVILEGVQQLYQFHQSWTSYRSTCEALKHEKYLYLGNAGPYAAADDPHVMLAERVESLTSEEHAKWVAAARQPAQGSKRGQGRGS